MTWKPKSSPPTKSGQYIVFTPTDDSKKPFMDIAYYFAENKEWGGVVEYWLKRITHWMELPEPPNADLR